MEESIYIEIFFASIFAFFIACLVSAGMNYKILTRFAGYFRISNKYGDENLFYYYLNNKNIDWIYVRDFPKKMIFKNCHYLMLKFTALRMGSLTVA